MFIKLIIILIFHYYNNIVAGRLKFDKKPFSRFSNRVYHRYINTVSHTDSYTRRHLLEQKRKWDIDFKHWSVDFTSPKSRINLIKVLSCSEF